MAKATLLHKSGSFATRTQRNLLRKFVAKIKDFKI